MNVKGAVDLETASQDLSVAHPFECGPFFLLPWVVVVVGEYTYIYIYIYIYTYYIIRVYIYIYTHHTTCL